MKKITIVSQLVIQSNNRENKNLIFANSIVYFAETFFIITQSKTSRIFSAVNI